MVILGAVFLGEFLEQAPQVFLGYWGICFVLVILVLALAIVDVKHVRSDFLSRQAELDVELATIVSDAETMAAENIDTE